MITIATTAAVRDLERGGRAGEAAGTGPAGGVHGGGGGVDDDGPPSGAAGPGIWPGVDPGPGGVHAGRPPPGAEGGAKVARAAGAGTGAGGVAAEGG
jgi:hypothetical protein